MKTRSYIFGLVLVLLSGCQTTEDSASRVALLTIEGTNGQMAFSPDGGQVDYVSGKSGNFAIWKKPIGEGEPKKITQNFATVNLVGWSPGGEMIYYIASHEKSESDIFTVPAKGGEPVKLTHSDKAKWSAQLSPDGSHIAYNEIINGNTKVKVLPTQGGDSRQLTTGVGEDYLPVWSPDGERIAYQSNRTGLYKIWAVSVNGGEPALLSTGEGNDFNPQWSPDSKRLAFVSNRKGNNDIWISEGEGEAPRQLTKDPGNDWSPRWSSNGEELAFLSNRGEQVDLWMFDEQENLSRITRDAGKETNLIWSTDGQFLGFNYNQARNVLWKVSSDGQARRQLTAGHRTQYGLDASPDGKWKTFASDIGGNPYIRLMPSKRGEIRQLTRGQGGDFTPVFSPDGASIAFVSTRKGAADIYTISVSGENEKQLTRNESGDFAPSWSPDGQWISFHSLRINGRNEVFIVSQETGETKKVSDNKYTFMSLWGKDGKTVYYSSDDNPESYPRVWKASIEEGSSPQELTFENKLITWDISPDGTMMLCQTAFEGDDINIDVLYLTSGEVSPLVHSPALETNPKWSPDGSMIGFISNASGEDQLYVQPPSGSPARQLTDGPGRVINFIWIPGQDSLIHQLMEGYNSDLILLKAQPVDGEV